MISLCDSGATRTLDPQLRRLLLCSLLIGKTPYYFQFTNKKPVTY